MDFIEPALMIGSRLCRDAIWADDRCNWVAPFDNYVNAKQPQRQYRPLDYDLYAGCAGVGAFLAALYQATKDDVFKAQAKGALKNSVALFDKAGVKAQGFFSGQSGLSTILIKSGLELYDEELVEEGIRLLNGLSVPADDFSTDIISGAAGTIMALAYLKTEFKIAVDDGLLTGLGEFLVNTAQKTEQGLSWKTMPNQRYHLTGLAHGAAGIAAALLKLYELFDKEDFLQIALGGVVYENALYSPKRQNWPDLRNITYEDFYRGKFNYSNAWCHGAPGIGLSRLYFYKVLGTADALNDLNAAVASTLAGINSTVNHSMCHGLAGNIDFLIEANKLLNIKTVDQLIADTGKNLYNNYLQHHLPLLSGLNDRAEVPGFMMGLAGTGYFLLRCADPVKVKSLLLLA